MRRKVLNDHDLDDGENEEDEAERAQRRYLHARVMDIIFANCFTVGRCCCGFAVFVFVFVFCRPDSCSSFNNARATCLHSPTANEHTTQWKIHGIRTSITFVSARLHATTV